jgi:hypothetical protein
MTAQRTRREWLWLALFEFVSGSALGAVVVHWWAPLPTFACVVAGGLLIVTPVFIADSIRMARRS